MYGPDIDTCSNCGVAGFMWNHVCKPGKTAMTDNLYKIVKYAPIKKYHLYKTRPEYNQRGEEENTYIVSFAEAEAAEQAAEKYAKQFQQDIRIEYK